MATATLKYLGDLRTECTHTASGTVIVTDAPVDNHGKGEAFSATDLCATALGACAMTIMGIHAQEHNIDITGATADVTKTMGIGPRRISQIDITFHMPAKGYTNDEKQALEGVFTNCPVCHSLHPDIVKNVVFQWSK